MTAARRFDPLALVGKSLQQGRYTLKQFIGQGSFAFVYRAEETLGGQWLRDVAVKWILDGDLAQIVREARALAAMPSHANIVSFLTTLPLAPPTPGLMLVLEFAEGKPMDQLIADGRPRSSEETVKMMADILTGLGHAHAHKVIHRDLKPENVVARADGLLKITDFGIARSAEGDAAAVRGEFKGSPAYMAPEQFGKEHDYRVDLYAAGIMTYELLLGYRPFNGTSVEIMRGHLSSEVPLPAEMTPNLRQFLLRALAKKPEERFETAEQMLEALRLAAYADSPALGHRSSAEQPGGVLDRDAASTGRKRSRHSSGKSRTAPTVTIFPDATPPAERPWAEAATDERAIPAALALAMPGARALCARAGAELQVCSAVEWPIWRLSRRISCERRGVVERFELYNNERLSRPTFEAPEDVDPWSPVFAVERPTPKKPASIFRIQGTDRQLKCLRCRGRGRLACTSCDGKGSSEGCPECGGASELQCVVCEGMGEHIGYLAIEAWFETRETLRVVKPPGLSAEIFPQDIKGAKATAAFKASGTVLLAFDLPAPLPWPEVSAAADELFETELPEDSEGVSDEMAIEWLTAGRADCKLGGHDMAVEVIPEAGIIRADGRQAAAVDAWARRVLSDQAAWDQDPIEHLALCREVLESPMAEEWNDTIQTAALAFGRRVLEGALPISFKEPRIPFTELIALDKKKETATAWEALSEGRKKALSERFMAAVTGGKTETELAAVMGELARVGFKDEAKALFVSSLSHVQELVRKNDFEHSDPLVRALASLSWPNRNAAETFLGLTLKALKERCVKLEQDCEHDVPVEAIVGEIGALLPICPNLHALPAALRAVQNKLVKEILGGNLASGFHWSRRMQEELSGPRKDQAALFANVLEGNEEAYVAAMHRMFQDPARFVEALELMTVPSVRPQDDPRLGELATTFAEVLADRCELAYEHAAIKGTFDDALAAEMTRALAAWGRLEKWSPEKPLSSKFVQPLWSALHALLKGPQPERAQPLLESAEQLATVRDDREVGPLVHTAREANVHEVGMAASDALKGGSFLDFKKKLVLLLDAVPKHKLVSRLIFDFQNHLQQLGAEGKVAELVERAQLVRLLLQARKLPEPPLVRDPLNQLSADLEKFILTQGVLPEGISDVLRTIAWLRSHNIHWVHPVSMRLDRACERLFGNRQMRRRLAVLPEQLVMEGIDKHSTLALMAEEARKDFDDMLKRVSMLATLPLALEIWPRLYPGFGVSPVQTVAFRADNVATWLTILVGSIVTMGYVPSIVRAVMERFDSQGRLARPVALLCGAAASVLAFAAGAGALKVLTPKR